jgi:glycosyltransferase involved in cell wall biosynthesis
MEMTPTVTVMVTTYNHSAYIRQTLESVLGQHTKFPFEMIVGEDCSTDDTRAIVFDFQRRFPGIIRVVFGDENVGAFHNSNRCFARARGEFVAYCEGDDFWQDPLKLQKQVDYLSSHPECGLVHSDYDYLVYNFGAWRLIRASVRPKKKAMVQGRIYRSLLKQMLVRTCTMMGRTELLKEHYNSQLRTPVHAVGDRPIVLHMSQLADIDYLDESLATYRRAPGSMTNVGHARLLNQVKRKIDMFRSFYMKFGAEEAEWVEMQRICYRENLRFSFLAKNEAEFSDSLDWLRYNDQKFAGSFGVLLKSVLIRFPGVCSLLFAIKYQLNELQLFLLSKRKSV